ncbi:unnamed protein product [Urochloa humidicola]
MPKRRRLQGAAGVQARVRQLPLVDKHADELCDSYLEAQKNIFQVLRTVWASDGLTSERGIRPGVTGSLVTGATYFGVIESTKAWLENANPILSGHWSHFIAGAIGDTHLGFCLCAVRSHETKNASPRHPKILGISCS